MHRTALAIFIVALLAVTLLPACTDDQDHNGVGNTDFFAEESLSVDIMRQTRTRFALQGINGTVRISGSTGASGFSIDAVRRVESDSFDDAAEHLEQLQVVVDSSGTQVLVRTDQPHDTGGRNYIVTYVIEVPADVVVVIANVNGNITVDSLNAAVTLACVNGNINATALTDNSALAVVNGTINATLSLPPGGQAVLGVTNGNIALRIPKDTSAQFAATVVNGTISLTELLLSDVAQTPTSLTGTLRDGDGNITLSAVNGNIAVTGF